MSCGTGHVSQAGEGVATPAGPDGILPRHATAMQYRAEQPIAPSKLVAPAAYHCWPGSLTFCRPHAAEEVYVTGTFDNWSKSEKLEKVGDHFEKTVTLPETSESIFYKVRYTFPGHSLAQLSFRRLHGAPELQDEPNHASPRQRRCYRGPSAVGHCANPSSGHRILIISLHCMVQPSCSVSVRICGRNKAGANEPVIFSLSAFWHVPWPQLGPIGHPDAA